MCKHQELIDQILDIAKELYARTKDLTPLLFTIDQQGGRKVATIDRRYFHDEATKELLVHLLRDFLKQASIMRYALALEGWVARCQPPLTDANESLARYNAEYERRGWSPDHAGGREECLIITVCDRAQSTTRAWTIRRDPVTGYMTELVAMDDLTEAVGRFSNLFDQQAH